MRGTAAGLRTTMEAVLLSSVVHSFISLQFWALVLLLWKPGLQRAFFRWAGQDTHTAYLIRYIYKESQLAAAAAVRG